MVETFSSNSPIYLQMMNRICAQIVRGDLKRGDKLPSVRDSAIQFGVNPNTVQRVNAELERLGIVEMKRGQGTFVTEDNELLNGLRDQFKGEQIAEFATNMTELGFTEQEMIDGLRRFLDVKRAEDH